MVIPNSPISRIGSISSLRVDVLIVVPLRDWLDLAPHEVADKRHDLVPNLRFGGGDHPLAPILTLLPCVTPGFGPISQSMLNPIVQARGCPSTVAHSRASHISANCSPRSSPKSSVAPMIPVNVTMIQQRPAYILDAGFFVVSDDTSRFQSVHVVADKLGLPLAPRLSGQRRSQKK